MKKIIFILIAICFFSSNTYADHKGWPHGKKWAYNCAKTTECNIIIENINKQPKLFIGKSVYSGNRTPINIADKGKRIKPNKMLGIWGEDWKSSPTNGSKKILWDDFYDSMIYAPAIDDGNEIFLNEQFKNEVMDGGIAQPFRHSISISHLLQSGKLEKLKEGLINGAKDNWLKVLQSDPFLYQSGEHIDFQAYGNSLGWFYPTIIPLLEAHIVLQRNDMYTEEEFKMVHSWLEKRVWVLEQGPLDGLVSSGFDWNNFFEAANHETINKKVAYMLWGVADQNEIYFTAALNGFEDFYKSMRKKDGTFKNEHKKGDGANYGLSSGNFVGQSMIVMAVILQHQGIDVRKKYRKIEKFVQWASKNYKDPEKLGYGGGNNDLRFLTNDPLKRNTVGWMYLWDKEFGTNYAESNNFPSESRTMTVYGIADASSLLNPSSNAKETQSPSSSDEEIVNLPNDTSSGYKKVVKSLTGKYYKDYGMQVVNKEDGHPVRKGEQSIRFEVRSGDCGEDEGGGWSDCKNDRERHEVAAWQTNNGDAMSKGEYWFAWSVYFPEDHQNLYPLSNNYGQFHQKGGPPVFMFKELMSGYTVVRTIGGIDYDERKLIHKKKMPGKWFDILINVKWTKKNNGFFKVWVNDELKYDYEGPTKTEEYVYQKFGIYRTGITRYLNYKNKSHIQKCLDENSGTNEEYGSMYDLRQKKIRHKISIQLYNKCKDYYEVINVPTTIVYFDEVRKGKSKESVTKNLTSIPN